MDVQKRANILKCFVLELLWGNDKTFRTFVLISVKKTFERMKTFKSFINFCFGEQKQKKNDKV